MIISEIEKDVSKVFFIPLAIQKGLLYDDLFHKNINANSMTDIAN